MLLRKVTLRVSVVDATLNCLHAFECVQSGVTKSCSAILAYPKLPLFETEIIHFHALQKQSCRRLRMGIRIAMQ